MTENFVESSTIHEDDELLITDLQTCYQQITESLLYAIIQTCLNLITVLSKLLQFNVKATFFYFKVQIRALQYVRDTLDYDIIYISNNSNKVDTELAIYFNVNYVNDSATQKSMSDYIIMFCGEPIS